MREQTKGCLTSCQAGIKEADTGTTSQLLARRRDASVKTAVASLDVGCQTAVKVRSGQRVDDAIGET